MAMGRRLAAWRVGHDEGDQALSWDVWDGVLEDLFHLLELLGMPGGGRQRDRREYCGYGTSQLYGIHCILLTLVDVAAAHDGSSLPACSATMYAAYQSGQFGSVAPVRFSRPPWAADARPIALARSRAQLNLVAFGSMRPGNRAVISCSSQTLPSGSLNVRDDA